MFRIATTARRWTHVALLAALVCVARLPAPGTVVGYVQSLRAIPAETLFDSIPSFLTRPSLPRGSGLLSVLTHDIDADGDLDVVANDGSLELIVWINDGTGQLTRQVGRTRNPTPRIVSGPAVSSGGPGLQVFAGPLPSPVLDAAPRDGEPHQSCVRPSVSLDSTLPVLASASSPRGPPTSLLAN